MYTKVNKANFPAEDKVLIALLVVFLTILEREGKDFGAIDEFVYANRNVHPEFRDYTQKLLYNADSVGLPRAIQETRERWKIGHWSLLEKVSLMVASGVFLVYFVGLFL